MEVGVEVGREGRHQVIVESQTGGWGGSTRSGRTETREQDLKRREGGEKETGEDK